MVIFSTSRNAVNARKSCDFADIRRADGRPPLRQIADAGPFRALKAMFREVLILFPEDVGVNVRTEQLDDIPILLSLLIRLRIPQYIDSFYTPHGNRQGLSVGWVTTIWLVYILTESDHRMNHVQAWVSSRIAALSELAPAYAGARRLATQTSPTTDWPMCLTSSAKMPFGNSLRRL